MGYMAIFHMTASVISRGKNTATKTFSATKAAAYRSGEKIRDERTGEIHDYTKRRDDVLHSNILAPKGAQDWVHDRSTLANKIETTEKRKDSQLIRSLEGALPIEMNLNQQIEMVEKFLNENFIRKGMVADYSIHMKPDKEAGHPNPHVHIGLSMRSLEGDGFGKKERSWNDFEDEKGKIIQNKDKTLHKGWRQSWADLQNDFLEKHGYPDRVDPRSYEEQGIHKIPQKHEGKTLTVQKRRGRNHDETGKQYDRIYENQFISHKNQVNDYIYVTNKPSVNDNRKLEQLSFQKMVAPKSNKPSERHDITLTDYLESTKLPSVHEMARINRISQINGSKTENFSRSGKGKASPYHSSVDELDVAANAIIAQDVDHHEPSR